MNIWDVTILLAVAAALVFALRRVRKSKGACGGNCGCCSGCAGACEKKDMTDGKR